MLFEEIYEEFKKYAQKRHKKQGFITLTYDFNCHVLPCFCGCDIKKITKADIIKWQDSILEHNYKNKYNARLYYVFKKFMDYCVNCSYIEENIVQSVGPFPKNIEVKHFTTYNLHQFRKFRKYVENFVIKQYFNFLYFYGTRPSEAMGLRFLDYKKHKFICIVHSLQRKGNRELDTPKNQSSIRCFKINFIMRFRIFLLKQYYIRLYGKCDDDYFIFGGQKPLAPTTIDRYKKIAYIKAKLPPITQHQFRHSFATRKVRRVPINKLSYLLGHSQVSTTLDVYVHQEKKYTDVLLM